MSLEESEGHSVSDAGLSREWQDVLVLDPICVSICQPVGETEVAQCWLTTESWDAKRNEEEFLSSRASPSGRLLEEMHPYPHVNERFLLKSDLLT